MAIKVDDADSVWRAVDRVWPELPQPRLSKHIRLEIP